MPTFDAMRIALQDHQIGRLRETYDDLIHDPTYATLAEFFFTHLYHTGDRQARNDSFLKLHRHIKAIMGTWILKGLSDLIELHLLSETLDDQVAEVLRRMEVTTHFSRQDYDRAYRYADNYEDRILQLDYLERSNVFVHKVSQMRFVGTMLATLKRTADLIGASPMIDFLDMGYQAYHKVPDIRPFLQIMRTREQARLDRIWKDVPMEPRLANP